jgi:hypothetical protein
MRSPCAELIESAERSARLSSARPNNPRLWSFRGRISKHRTGDPPGAWLFYHVTGIARRAGSRVAPQMSSDHGELDCTCGVRLVAPGGPAETVGRDCVRLYGCARGTTDENRLFSSGGACRIASADHWRRVSASRWRRATSEATICQRGRNQCRGVPTALSLRAYQFAMATGVRASVVSARVTRIDQLSQVP